MARTITVILARLDITLGRNAFSNLSSSSSEHGQISLSLADRRRIACSGAALRQRPGRYRGHTPYDADSSGIEHRRLWQSIVCDRNAIHHDQLYRDTKCQPGGDQHEAADTDADRSATIRPV